VIECRWAKGRAGSAQRLSLPKPVSRAAAQAADALAVGIVMFWLGLAWKPAALAWLRVALASRISKPSQSPHPWLGFGWLWPKPWLEAKKKVSTGVFSVHNLRTLCSDKGSCSMNYCKAEPSVLSPKAITSDSVHADK
jgi:hypothetical protein